MRVLALLATYNEQRFIGPCLEHLHAHGIDSYLIDNCSLDDTVELAEKHLGRGLVGVESFPRGEDDAYAWRALLTRKEELARALEADWFIHLDPDEVRLPPPGTETLLQAFEAADRTGFNAVNFAEFTFVPTLEEPDHDHPEFQRTLRTYYPFAPRYPHQLKAWKASEAIELAWSGGHEARFPGLKMYPAPFPMKHYLFLSVPHAIEKYVRRRYDRQEVESGWHGWRPRLTASAISLPHRSELLLASADGGLDSSRPRKHHWLAEQ
jgi:hypothetical protein